MAVSGPHLHDPTPQSPPARRGLLASLRRSVGGQEMDPLSPHKPWIEAEAEEELGRSPYFRAGTSLLDLDLPCRRPGSAAHHEVLSDEVFSVLLYDRPDTVLAMVRATSVDDDTF